MKTFTTIAELRAQLKEERRAGKTIGFVPTMGYLHEGHAALMNEARQATDVVVLSIFVNPLQFGPNEDFDSYPRDFARDEQVAKDAGVDYIFYPTIAEMYPTGKEQLTTSVVAHRRIDRLCGEKRPGHFDGVVTVVTKLFNIVQPDKAFFGLKDAQQVAVLQGLVDDLNIDVAMVGVPTVREEDGLAKSSRNVYLSPAERAEAPHLSRALQYGAELLRGGERNRAALIEAVTKRLTETGTGVIDYVDVLTYPDLQPTTTLSGQVIIALAYKYEKARLIDNLIMELN